MARHKSMDIRNIALCGHAGSGKTILAEAMLLKAKAIGRLGSIADGSTVSDYEREEKEHRYSLNSSVLHAAYAGHEIHIIDTPGQVDFQGGMISGLAAAYCAVVCVNAMRGVELITRKAWDMAGRYGLGRIIAITRMDGENVNFQEILAGVGKAFGPKCVPFVLTRGEGASFQAVKPAFAADPDPETASLRQTAIENAVEADDALMEKYLESGEISPEELAGVMPGAILSGAVVPVFALAGEKDIGIAELLDFIIRYAPSPLLSRRKLVDAESGAESVI